MDSLSGRLSGVPSGAMLEFYWSVLCMPVDNHCIVHGLHITPGLS